MKTTVKKMLAVILVLLLVFSACGSAENASESSGFSTSDRGDVIANEGLMPNSVPPPANYYPFDSDGYAVEESVYEESEIEWACSDDEAEFNADGSRRRDNSLEALPPAPEDSPTEAAPTTTEPFGGERYIPIYENSWVSAERESAVSFTLQIDTASKFSWLPKNRFKLQQRYTQQNN